MKTINDLDYVGMRDYDGITNCVEADEHTFGIGEEIRRRMELRAKNHKCVFDNTRIRRVDIRFSKTPMSDLTKGIYKNTEITQEKFVCRCGKIKWVDMK